MGTHFRLQVVSLHLAGRRDEASVLQGKGFFFAAIEEICDMGIFFCFRNSELAQSLSADDLSKNFIQMNWRKSNGKRKRLIIDRHTDISADAWQNLSSERCKVRICESTGNFPGTIRTEIEKYDPVAILNRSKSLLILVCHHNGPDKLICLLPVISMIHGFHRIFLFDSLSLRIKAKRLFHPLPPGVTIHCVETSANRRNNAEIVDADMLLQLPDISGTAFRRRVPAIKNGMDIHATQPLLPGHIQQGEQVGQLAVDTSVRNQSHEVKP